MILSEQGGSACLDCSGKFPSDTILAMLMSHRALTSPTSAIFTCSSHQQSGSSMHGIVWFKLWTVLDSIVRSRYGIFNRRGAALEKVKISSPRHDPAESSRKS
jgi:hypothetical protein